MTTSPRYFLVVVAIACLIICAGAGLAQRRGSQPRRGSVSSTPAVQNAASQQDFDTLSTQATTAREADKVDDAIELYRKAVAIKPDWAEGWWFLGTLYYDLNNFTGAAPAFKRAAEIQS